MARLKSPFDDPRLTDAEMYERTVTAHRLANELIEECLKDERLGGDGPDMLGHVSASLYYAMFTYFILYRIYNRETDADDFRNAVRRGFMRFVRDLWDDCIISPGL
jgi:hypothetical protein